ncbi:MAG: hypothetical protein AAGA86_08190, partial [Bacteroidota bacterium]
MGLGHRWIFLDVARRYFLFFLFISAFSGFSQINNADYRVETASEDLLLCADSDDSRTVVNIRSKTDQNNTFQIAFDLPDGVRYVNGSIEIVSQQGSLDYGITVDDTDSNAPIFYIERPANANWQINDIVRFRFAKIADCDALDYLFNGGLFKDAHTITYNSLTGTRTESDTDPTINSYNFLTPILSLINYSNSTAAIGETITRSIEVPNSGTGSTPVFTHVVAVDDDLDNTYELSFNGTVLTPTSISAGIYTYEIDFTTSPFFGAVGDLDANFEEGESVLLEESFSPENFGTHTITHTSEWGCGSTGNCRGTSPFSGLVDVGNELPELVISEISTFGTTDFSTPSTYSIQIENVNPNYIAFNVNINTGQSLTTPIFNSTVNGLFGNDVPRASKAISNFRFAAIPGTTLNTVRIPYNAGAPIGAGSYGLPSDYDYGSPGTDPDGPGGLEDLDGDGFFDDLGPGSSTILLFDYENLPDFSSCISPEGVIMSGFHISTGAYGENLSGTQVVATPLTVNNGIIRKRGRTIERPLDVFDGDSFTIGIQGTLELAGRDYPDCNGIPFFSADPSTAWTINLTIPNGITLEASAGPEFSQSGNTITYTTTDLPDTLFYNENVDFPLHYSCGSNISGPLDINYEIRYSNGCMDEAIHCDTFTLNTSCPTTCTGPYISSFDARRITAGWTDGTMATRVSLNDADHALDTYAARDRMVITATGEVRTIDVDNLHFDITYTTVFGGGGADLIEFIRADTDLTDSFRSQFLIDGVPIDFSIEPNITTDVDTYRMHWDLSAFRTLYPDGTTIELRLLFQWDDDFFPDEIYELDNFRGEYYTLDPGGSRTVCGTIGERATYVKPEIYTQNRNGSGAGCQQIYDVNRLAYEVGNSLILFPNEYRPAYILESMLIDIPQGTTFLDQVGSTDYPGDPDSDNGGLNFSVLGDQVMVTPGPGFIHPDFGDLNYPEINLLLQLGGNTPDTSIQSYEVRYFEYPYSDDPEAITVTQDKTFNYDAPDFTLGSSNPIIDGTGTEITFEVDFCSDTINDLDFNWLQLSHGPDFVVTSATEVDGSGTETPIDFEQGTDQSWIRSGTFPTGYSCKKIRFSGTFSTCTPLDITVENAFSCFEYPTDITGYQNARYTNPLTLKLEPKTATIQLQILDQPTASVDLCTDFDVVFELRSADSGNLLEPYATFFVPGDISGVVLNEVMVEYPRGSNDLQPVSTSLDGNTYRVNVMEHTAILGQGILGASDAGTLNDQIAIINLDISLQCDFNSNSPITYTVFGNQPCGQSAVGSGSRLATAPLVITGAEPSYTVDGNILDTTGGTLQGCGPHTITVNNVVVDDGPTSSADISRIILPPGLTADIASFTATSPLAVTNPTLSVVGDHEEIQINLPDGAVNSDVISYAFDVFLADNIESCSPEQTISVETFEMGENILSCNGTSCGTLEIAVGSISAELTLEKPALAQFGPANVFYNESPDGTLEYEITLGLENTSSLPLDAGYTYNVYCSDDNGNISGDVLYTGTGTQELPASGTISERFTFSVEAPCDNGLLVEFAPSAANCLCSALLIPVDQEQRFADLEVSITSDIVDPEFGETVRFSVQVANDGPFDAREVVLQTLVPPGFSITLVENDGEQNTEGILWSNFNLVVGEFRTFVFEATVNVPSGTDDEFTMVSQVLDVWENDPDSTPGNYSNTRPLEDDEAILEVITPAIADLEITKTADVSSAVFGDTVVFTVTISNLGPNTANTIVIQDNLPNGFQLISVETSLGSYANDLGEWTIPSLGVNEDATLTMTTEAVEGDDHTNVALLLALDEIDNNADNNRDEATVNMIQDDCLTVYNEFSPNGDNSNEVFFIECIEDYPNSLLQI